MRFLLPAVLVALCVSAPAVAQPADSLCTYDACALRVESAFLGTRLVRGVDAVPAARRGLFGSDLSSVVAPSERALEHARIYDRTRTPALVSAIGSSLLLVLATSAPNGGDGLLPVSDGVRLGMTVGAVAFGVVSIRLGLRSQRAFSRAIWWYNRDLSRR